MTLVPGVGNLPKDRERMLVMHPAEIVGEGRTAGLLAAAPPDDPALPWQPFPDEAERQVA